ncbi:MAG: VanW family protein [Bacillota bacterium]
MENVKAVVKSKWVILCLSAAGGIIVFALSVLGVDYIYYHTRVYPGVQLYTVNLGGLRFEEAADEIEAKLWSRDEVSLVLEDGSRVRFSFSEMGLAWDKEATISNVRLAGRGIEGYAARINYLFKQIPIIAPGRITVDEKRLGEAAARLAGTIYQAPRDASLQVESESVTVIPEQGGRYLKVGELRENLINALCRGETELAVPIGEWPAPLTAADLESYGLQTVMASYYTNVAVGNPDRTENVRLGAAAINGFLMAPGDRFSFWEVVGQATLEKGYRYAPIIRAGVIVPGIGGGLCQVSSTLYNAALLANLKIVERYNHSLTQGYIPLGRDATVAYPTADIKFVNSRDHYLLIGSELSNNRLTFRIFGPPMEERVEIVTSLISQIAPPVRYEKTGDLPVGVTVLVKSGKPGYQVTVWRIVYRRDTEVERELLSRDYYSPMETVYQVGTGD